MLHKSLDEGGLTQLVHNVGCVDNFLIDKPSPEEHPGESEAEILQARPQWCLCRLPSLSGEEEMELLPVILWWAGGVVGISYLLILAWAIAYDFAKTRINPGFDHPWKLRAKILECLGVCTQLAFVRLMTDLRRHKVPPNLYTKDLDFDGVAVRIYLHKTPSPVGRKGFVFFHGGAGLAGSISSYQNICNRLANESGSVVVSVGYRLSPEYPFPAQSEDCHAATVHFMKNAEVYGVDPSQIVIGGDSAGGNFATMIAQKLAGRSDLPKLRAQVLIYAGVQAMDFTLPSYQQNARMPFLFRENLAYYGLQALGKDPSLSGDMLRGSHVPHEMRLKYEKYVSPDNLPERFKRRGYRPVPPSPFKPEAYEQLSDILDASFSTLFADDAVIRQLPETFIVSCEYDILRDDSLLYKKRLEDNGVKVGWFHAENGFHGVINFFDLGFFSFPLGIEILSRVAEFVKHL
nr:PREDICTED: arylacetamide deacetylase-like 3 [Anolis carolinensis]|eukprot:XP_003229239.1 PREDICTED: arylacetamide deacetylase-like 3 [Anolis carolinensis]